MDNLTPNDYSIIPSSLRITTEDGSEAVGGTIGGLGTTPVSNIGDVFTSTGELDATKISGTVPTGNIDIAARGWVQNCTFSVTDANTVSWTSGRFTASDGTEYVISAGNTDNMTAKTYIYLDSNSSTSTYRTTTTASNAVGAGKVLIAIAENGTTEATFCVFQNDTMNLDGADIAANTVAAAQIVANTITANELSTSITYAGSLIIDSAGLMRSGQTAYNTGTGWWIGNDSGTPKFSIGNPSGQYLTWDGTNLNTNFRKPVVRLYTSDDTWTKPTQLQYLMVEVVGGGGGGGGTSTNTEGSGGGGAGGYSRKYIAVATLGATESVTVGGAGGGGAGTGGTGGDGGTTSFGAHCQATGGTGGTQNGGGGSGGVGSGGDLNLTGAKGGDGSSSNSLSGAGGNSYYGCAGAQRQESAGAGYAAGGYGSGGGGAVSAGPDAAGGGGGSGAVYVTEYYL